MPVMTSTLPISNQKYKKASITDGLRRTPKTIHDYFARVPVGSSAERRLGPRGSNPVPGLIFQPDFVSPIEEAFLLSFLDTENWRVDLARRTIHYGGTYCLMPPRDCSSDERRRIESTVLTADPLPSELQSIVDRMVKHQLYPAEARPAFCIVNEYTGTHGISPHVENFRFGEPVCGLSLGDGDHMRFHELEDPDDGSVRSGRASQAARTGRRVDVWLPRRSLVIMRGEARSKWQHEIVRKKRTTVGNWRRVSLTFRVERNAQGSGKRGQHNAA